MQTRYNSSLDWFIIASVIFFATPCWRYFSITPNEQYSLKSWCDLILAKPNKIEPCLATINWLICKS